MCDSILQKFRIGPFISVTFSWILFQITYDTICSSWSANSTFSSVPVSFYINVTYEQNFFFQLEISYVSLVCVLLTNIFIFFGQYRFLS